MRYEMDGAAVADQVEMRQHSQRSQQRLYKQPIAQQDEKEIKIQWY